MYFVVPLLLLLDFFPGFLLIVIFGVTVLFSPMPQFNELSELLVVSIDVSSSVVELVAVVVAVLSDVS